MTDRNKNTALFQNILVAVDASVHSEASLDAAVYLAHHLGSKVKGLFVRSPELHHICRLTFLSEVSELTGEIRPLAEQSMEKQISQAEKRIQHLVQFVKIRSRISCTWTSVVGSVAEQVLDAAGDADLIILGQTGRSLSGSKRLAASIRTVIRESGKPVLVIRRGMTPEHVVIAVYDGSKQSQQSLETALALAGATNRSLSVMILANDSNHPDSMLDAVRDQIGESDIPVDISLLNNFRVWDFVRAVNRYPPGFLVIPKDQPLTEDRRLSYLLDLLKHPLLLTN